MKIHVQTWRAACNARITEMANAGKRGKTCRVLRFIGAAYACNTSALEIGAKAATANIMGTIDGFTPDTDFATAAGILVAMVDKARADGIPESYVAIYPEEIKGVDAPLPLLTASGDGWDASADESGISINDEKDQYNLPCMITHRQTNNQAYRLAAKVWDKVKAARSFHEAGDILSAAGCRLHYFCRMD